MHFLGFFPRQCTVDLSVNVNFTKPVAPFIWPVKYIKLGQILNMTLYICIGNRTTSGTIRD